MRVSSKKTGDSFSHGSVSKSNLRGPMANCSVRRADLSTVVGIDPFFDGIRHYGDGRTSAQVHAQ